MAKICEICCEFIVLQDKRNTRYMDNGNENNISGREKFDMKAWMEEHPQEYGEFAAAMGEADLLEVFLLGSAAFNTSPEFQKRLENMIDLDNMDLDELLKILQESDFAEKIFGEQAEGSEWAKYRLPFAVHESVNSSGVSPFSSSSFCLRFRKLRLNNLRNQITVRALR